ncbi:ATP-binding protein, partial [bacterium]|nr:ATP-binding protein [bacterium]
MVDKKIEQNELDLVISKIHDSLPYPIAFQLNKYTNNHGKTFEDEWLLLCDIIFIESIKLLSYILLSELAAYEIKIGKLYYHIENILSRPLGGNYVGFLREATLELKEKNITPLSHQIVDFIYKAEKEKILHPNSKSLLNEILNYRNSIAHGGVTPSIAKREIKTIRKLFAIFLTGLSFFKEIELISDKGQILHGSELKELVADSITTYVKFSDNNEGTDIKLLPLLLSYKKNKLLLLSDFDAKNIKIHYQGQESYEIFSKKINNTNFVQELYSKLVELLDRVRALNAPQNSFERTRFDERIKIVTDITLTSYSYMGIYNSQNPMLYCVPDNFIGPNNKLDSFLQSDKNLLVISKNKGGGKSAFCAYCCDNLQKRDYSVFFINGIDFTNINPKWQENPFYRLFSSSLNYNCDLNKKNVKKLVNKSEKELVFIIDEVDNISRIDEKWNKLRAIEDLLNWIDDVAQPGIKFIVSLNLEEYKKFDWLGNQDFEDAEVPISSNILSISYPSQDSEDQWVHYLDNFTIQNAKALYNKLQEEESLNMRP